MTEPTVDKREDLSPIKRALLEIRELRARIAAFENAASEPIAVVGLGCRLPGGVRDETTLWRVLAEGTDTVGEVPAERWDAQALYDTDPDRPGTMWTRAGGFLDDVAGFDAAFFGIAPREAASMDPQQRLTLEVAWEALEDAGIAPDSLAGSATGVFIGVGNSDYARMLFGARDHIDAYAGSGGSLSVVAGRLAYTLGLQGPALAVDTACSASLVAVHLACQSLRRRECDLALTGGVNLILSPDAHIAFTKSAHDGARWPLQDLRRRRRRLWPGRGLRRNRAAPAVRCPHARRARAGADPRLGGQPGRPQRRTHRAQRPGAEQP